MWRQWPPDDGLAYQGGCVIYPRAPYHRQRDQTPQECALHSGTEYQCHYNAICQRMANEVHKNVLPGDSHVIAMGSIKDEFGLTTSATTTPGLLKVMFLAMASRRFHEHDKDQRLYARCCNTS